MYCNHCGTPIPQDAQECPNCQAPAPSAAGLDAATVMFGARPAVDPAPPQPTQEHVLPDYAANTVMTNAAVSQPTYVPPVYTPPAYTPPVYTAAAPAKKKIKPALIVVIVLALLLLCCLAAVAAVVLLKPEWLPFEMPKLGGGSAKSNDYLLGYIQKDDEFDVAWLHGKEETLLFEDTLMDANYNGISYLADGVVKEYLWNAIDFMPNDPNTLLMRVMDDEDTVIKLHDLKKGTEIELFKTAYTFTGYLLENGTFIFVENRTESMRAYVSDGKTEAVRVLKADSITYQPALNQFSVIDFDEDDGLYQLFDLQGNELVTLYEGEILNTFIFSTDGSQMSYLRSTDDGVEAVLVDTRSGEEISVNDTYTNITSLFTAAKGSLIYFFGENEDGFLSLEASLNGAWTLLAEGAKGMSAIANPDAAQMAYISTDEEGTSTLYVVELQSGESEELMVSEDILTLMSETKMADTFFVTETMDEESTLYRCSFRGGSPLPLIEDSEASISYLYGLNGVVHVNLYNAADSTSSLWVMPEKAEEGFMLLEDWYSVYAAAVANDGSRLILSGTEEMGDDSVLLMVDVQEGAELIEIDDDFTSLWNSYLSSDGKTLLYNVQVGDNDDDAEVRSIDLMDKELPVVTLHEEARIIATAWETFDYDRYWYSFEVYKTEGSAVSRLGVGSSKESSLGGEVYEARFDTNLEAGQLYRIVVNAADVINPAITLYDASGAQLVYKNDFANAQESMFFAPPASGKYQIGISDWNSGSSQSDFSIELISVPVTVVEPGQSVEGAMGSTDAYQFGDLTQYMSFFLIPAELNDYLTITVEDMGTDVPFGLQLMDAYYTYQTGSYGYGTPASVYYNVYTAGSFILAVTDDSTFYGLTYDFDKDHKFTVTVSQ